MPSNAKLLHGQRWLVLICLFTFCLCLYLISYSARIESGDALRLIDGVSSLVDHGDLLLDLSAWQFPPSTSGSVTFGVDVRFPLETVSVEPGQILAAVPFYLAARVLPEIGLVHAVYLTNVVIGALTVCVLYLFVIALGYRERTALITALLLAGCTAWFPYTKSFFREPLMGLALLVAALAFDRLRAQHYRSWGWLLIAVLSVLALILTKSSGVMALPALLLFAAPPLRHVNRRLIGIVIVILGLITLIFVLNSVFELIPGLSGRYDIFHRLRGLSWQYFPEAMAAYLISPGGSLWGTSPVLLLSVIGLGIWTLRGARRYAVAVSLLIGTFAVGYALLNGVFWFGGLSWPQRFLIPVIPLAMLAAAPVIERLLWRPLAALLILAPLAAYSLWVQWAGVSLWWGTYSEAYPPEAGGLLEWSGSLYDPQFFRWVMAPSLLEIYPRDFAWAHISQPHWPLLFAAHGGLCLAALLPFVQRRLPLTAQRWMRVFLLLTWLLLTTAYLRQLYHRDTRYLATDDSLHRALEVLETETSAGDVILLGSPRYYPFFLNYAKFRDAGRVITLRLQPGERPSPEQAPEVISDHPAALMHPETIPLLTNLALTHDRIWLVSNGSPDLWWSIRPAERYLGAYYHPVRVITTGENTRLLEYDTTPAPSPFAFYRSSRMTDLVFGDVLRLTGYELRGGDTFAAGDAVPVALEWMLTQPVDADFTVALFLRRPDGFEVTQNDWLPYAGFGRTSTWLPNVPYWDSRALRLPEDSPPGEYQLWVVVYDFAPDGTRRDQPVTGADTLDGVIGVLPVRITVTQGETGG